MATPPRREPLRLGMSFFFFVDGHPGSSVAAGQDKTATVILKRSSTGRAAVQRGCVCPVAAVQRRERNGGRRGGRALRSKLISKDRVEKRVHHGHGRWGKWRLRPCGYNEL